MGPHHAAPPIRSAGALPTTAKVAVAVWTFEDTKRPVKYHRKIDEHRGVEHDGASRTASGTGGERADLAQLVRDQPAVCPAISNASRLNIELFV